jgi:regulator of sigma E protease
LDIILALIALGILVTVHETGHFIAARLCGIRVEAFSIGFGKPLFRFRKKETDYRIGWLPLGGYVRMKGENPDDEVTDTAGSFQHATWWKKAVIAFSGPLANLLLALLIFIVSYLLPGRMEDHYPVVGRVKGNYSETFLPGDSIAAANGKPVKGWYNFLGTLSAKQQNKISLYRNGNELTLNLAPVDPADFALKVEPKVEAVVGEVNPGMSAWRAGLQPGDRILVIDGVKITDWYQMRELITGSQADTISLTLLRKNRLLEKRLDLEKSPLSDGQKLIGITQAMPVSYVQSNPPLQAVTGGITSTFGFLAVNYVSLYRMISRPETIKSSVGGPVMIYSLSRQSANKGLNNWFMFVAAISLVLMIMNLLPIPVLDGGHILFAIIQGITGKPLPHKVQVILQNIGLLLLLLLMVYAFYSDISKLIARMLSAGR